MGTEHYITELLYRYNCVVVPGFGAFLTQTKSAVINESTHSFSPPSKIISFNGQLSSNDGLLVSYMADAEKMSYENMEKQIASISQQWNTHLKTGERLRFPNIGELWQAFLRCKLPDLFLWYVLLCIRTRYQGSPKRGSGAIGGEDSFYDHSGDKKGKCP